MNYLSLMFIKLAKYLTTWGYTYDHLKDAEIEQQKYINARKAE